MAFVSRLSPHFLLRLTAALLCCAHYSALGQRYPFYNLNIENGLIQSQPTSLAQDRFGNLWIGTLGGLSRYDGKTFTGYTVRDSMLTNTVSSLAFDSSGLLWIGSPKGLSSFDGKRFRHYMLQPDENSSRQAGPIGIGSDNTVYCLSAGKLFRIRKGAVTRVELPAKEAFVVSFLSSGRHLDIATADGMLYRWNGHAWDSTAAPLYEGKQKKYIIRMYRDRRDRLWLMTVRGLYYFDGQSVHRFRPANNPDYVFPALFSAAEDPQGNLWFGTASGAIKVNDSSVQAYNKSNGLTDNPINKVLADAEGNIWLASDGQGLFRFSGAPMIALDESMGLPSAQVMSIAAGRDGTVFLGTYDAGVFAYREQQGIRKLPFAGNVRPAITAMTMQHNGTLWIGTRSAGLYRYRGGAIEPTAMKPGNSITALYTDSHDAVWVGLLNGFCRIGRDSLHRLSEEPLSVADFCEIGRDSMLLATADRILLWHNGQLHPFKTQGPADVATPQCFTLRGRELWIGTNDNGLIGYDLRSGKSVVINKSNGLRSDFIYNITTDNEGNVWAGTGLGIHKLSFRSGQPQITFFGKGQGVTGLESNHNAVWKMQDGSIWFGTTNGALHYRPHAGMVPARPTGLILQSVKVFGEDIRDSSYFSSTDPWYGVPQGLRLPYRKNNITFNFQGISLSGAEGLLYRYRIQGLEAPWSDWSSTTSVTFSAVPPGKYALHIQCSTNGKTIDQELNYPFEIIAPFHKTGLFRLVILGGCILLGVSIQYMANRRKRNREQQMENMRREEQNKVRQRTAEDFHDEVGNKLTRINVLTNVLKAKIGNMGPDALRIIEQIQDNTGQLYSGTRDILWSLKPSNDNLQEILHRIRDFGAELFQDTEIDFVFTGHEEPWKNYRLPLDYSRNLTMVFKEALNNALKYAGANKVQLDVNMDVNNNLVLYLKDNGKGFSIDQVKRGHGIDNMNVRARRLGGTLDMVSEPGRGTAIRLSFKIPSNKG